MCPVTFTALAVTAGMTAGSVGAAVVGTAISGAMIGMGATAAMNVATGQSITSGLGKGALFGAISGGISGGLSPASFAGIGATGSLGLSGVQGLGYAGMLAPSAASIAISGAAGSLMNAMQPEAYSAEAYDYSPIAYNSIHNQVTGSGGNQASAVLSDEIKKAKAKRVKQAQPKQDSYVNKESFANTGLQLA